MTKSRFGYILLPSHPLTSFHCVEPQIAEDLGIIRNNVVFIYVMMNFLWCVIALQLQAMEDTLKTFYIVGKYEPLSLTFLAIFALVLLLQFLSMLVHRWGTFLHLMASTRIDWCNKSHSEEEFARYVVQQTKMLQNLEPLPDYDDEDEDEFSAEDDGMLLSDFDPSLRHHPGDGNRGEQKGSDICETLGHHCQHRYPRQTNPHRTTSTSGQFPLLKTMFEQKLTDLQQRYKQRGSLRNGHGRSPIRLGTQRRYWGDRNWDMRQRFFSDNFQLPPQRGDRLFRANSGDIV